MKCVLVVFLGFFFGLASAQEAHKLSGIIFDDDGDKIEIVDVLLLNSSGNLEKYTTSLDGTFLFDGLAEGTYILKIVSLGFVRIEQKILLEKNLEVVLTLHRNIETLQGVEVVGSKNPITYENGNVKIDVQNPVFSSIPDPLDMLSRIPNVQVAPDRESISLIGKGNPLIYLDNQRVDFEVLTGLSMDNIETMEIINNPSSKYEAEGRAVLLVKSKKERKRGFRWSVQETASFKRNFNNYLNTNYSYNSGKLEVRGNLALNTLGGWESNAFQFVVPRANIFSDYSVLIPKNNRTQLNSGLGLYLPLKKNDYVSLNAILKLQTDDFPITTETVLGLDDEQTFVLTDTDNDNTKDYFSVNFNWNKRLNNKLLLFSGAQYSHFFTSLETRISNQTDGNSFQLEESRDQSYSLDSFALRVDLENKISEKLQWDFGASWNDTRAKAFSNLEQIQEGEITVFDFAYLERLYSGYTSVSGNMGNQAGFTTGVRLEYNKVKSELAEAASPLVERQNTRLFPKASVNVQLDSTKALSINYAKSIQRPDFSRTSTIMVFINPVLEGSGNINLLPTITDEISMNYQIKNKTVGLGYYSTKNPITFTIRYDDFMETAILSQVNLEKETGFYLSLAAPFSKGIWASNNTLSLNYNKVTDASTESGDAKPFVYVYTNQQFRVAKDTTLALGGWALSEREEGIFKRNGQVIAEASISKTFNKKLQCTLRFNDIFRQLNFEEIYTLEGVTASGTYFGDGREVSLSIKYNLGGSGDSKFKNKDVDDNLKRIK